MRVRGPDPRVACAKSIGREQGSSRRPQRISAKGGGPSGRPAGRPYEESDRIAPEKPRPPLPWKPKRLMVFARDALGFGPGNAAHFSLAMAYLARSEAGQENQWRKDSMDQTETRNNRRSTLKLLRSSPVSFRLPGRVFRGRSGTIQEAHRPEPAP